KTSLTSDLCRVNKRRIPLGRPSNTPGENGIIARMLLYTAVSYDARRLVLSQAISRAAPCGRPRVNQMKSATTHPGACRMGFCASATTRFRPGVSERRKAASRLPRHRLDRFPVCYHALNPSHYSAPEVAPARAVRTSEQSE